MRERFETRQAKKETRRPNRLCVSTVANDSCQRRTGGAWRSPVWFGATARSAGDMANHRRPLHRSKAPKWASVCVPSAQAMSSRTRPMVALPPRLACQVWQRACRFSALLLSDRASVGALIANGSVFGPNAALRCCPACRYDRGQPGLDRRAGCVRFGRIEKRLLARCRTGPRTPNAYLPNVCLKGVL